MTVHLVNLTNPMMMKGPLREIIPISSQRVSVKMPSSRRIKRIHLLVAVKEVPYTLEHDMISLEILSISLNEVVAVDFTS
jgi:hypothetical protein